MESVWFDKKRNPGQRVPIKFWLEREKFEEGALQQCVNVASLPFIFHHVAEMPDGHRGYGMPIGCIAATEKVIVPNMVGVDIGCGMTSMRTHVRWENTSLMMMGAIYRAVRNSIPMGKGKWNKHQCDEIDMPRLNESVTPIVASQFERARYQLGSLGAGNHFIEFQVDKDGWVWVTIHSGSRNLGHTVGQHYNKLAIKLNERYFSSVPTGHELAFLPLDSQEGRDYMKEERYCRKFASFNRAEMMKRTVNVLYNTAYFEQQSAGHDIHVDCCHNYVQFEHHFKRNVLVHRKGATSAALGEWGVIPGAPDSSTFVVTGKGNPDSFNSCSHGAGRTMSSTQARKTLSLDEQVGKLNKLGVSHDFHREGQLHEMGGAYKDINAVMNLQEDLVNIEFELRPIANMKGV